MYNYQFQAGDKVFANGQVGEVTTVVPGNGSILWYFVQLDDGTEDRFTANQLERQ